MSDPYYAAYEAQNKIAERQRSNALARQAGGMLAAGNATGARNALWTGGELEAGYKVDDNAEAMRKREAEGALRVAKGIRAAVQAGHSPGEAYDTAVQLAPQLGIDPSHLQALRPAFEKDPRRFLDMIDAQAQKELQIVEGPDGIYGVDKGSGNTRKLQSYPGRPIEMDPSKNYYMPDDGSATDAQGQAATPPDADATWRSMIQRESGGKPGVLGPQTRYGRAEGMTQMLPATAEAMARKLGVPWRPDLMRGTTPAAAAYQEQLGRAYFEEGLQKYGGDPTKAAMYYHGGPNEKLWGPKTRAYAQAVAPGNLQGGAGADTVGGIPGYRMIQKGREGGAGHMASAADKQRLGLPADAPYWIDKDGKPSAVSGEKPNKPLTEYQGKSVEMLNAALGGNERLNDLANKGLYKPRTPTDSLFRNEKDGTTRLILRTDEDRQFVQAAKEWLAPILRKESGAAVTDGELATYMDIYIPKFEDSPTVMWQKAQARDRKMQSIYKANKQAYDDSFGTPARWKVLTDSRGQPGARKSAPAAPTRTRSGATVSNW